MHARSCTLASLVLLVAAAAAASGPQAPIGPSVLDEAAIRGVLGADHLVLTFPLARSLTCSASLRVELLDVADGVLAAAEQRITPVEARRPVSVGLALPPAVRDAKGGEPLLLYRVRYALVAEHHDRVEAAGTVALAAVVPDLFDLRVVFARYLFPSQSYEARVQTVNPVTGHPVAGVAVSGVLTIGDSTDASPITARITNTKGEAVLRYRTPASFASRDGELRVEARKGAQMRRLNVDLELLGENRIVVNSDKRLYQPGQWFHARGRVVTWAKRAVAKARVDFTLLSPDGEVVLQHEAVTNEFGIAAVDWQLPDTTRLGTFRLWAQELDREEEPAGAGVLPVEIRRYDLPNFTVTATPDRLYYLPGENAELDVAAAYLFGKPVRRGSVKVVREESRSWNYREQKWDTVEQDIHQGDLDADGHCRLHLDLSPAHEALKERDYGRYQDITYAVFVTDASTGRTEQRRVRVRVSRDSLHLYITGARLVDGVGDFYLTACYSDGSPAAVDVRVGLASREGSETIRMLRVVRTNRYGAAKVTGLALDQEAEPVNLVLQARDRTGRNVRWDERPWWERQRLHVSTNKTLYRPGESMMVAIRSALGGPAVVAVAQGLGPAIWSTRVQLRRGTTTVPIPGRPAFQGQLGVYAYLLMPVGTAEGSLYGGHTVLYPHDDRLRVGFRTTRASYQPGEGVTARLRVNTAAGAPVRSALGIAVIDKAVEERERTDDEFGSRYGGFSWDWSWWEDDSASIGDLSRRDLDELDPAAEWSDDLQQAAEVLLNRWEGGLPPDFQNFDYSSRTRSAYRAWMERRLEFLQRWTEPRPALPANHEELDDLIEEAGVVRSAIVDPWGLAYRYTFGVREDNRWITVTSAGPDKQFGSFDDLLVKTVTWKYFTAVGGALDRAAYERSVTSGRCIADMGVLRSELAARDIDVDTLQDPWGHPYRFDFRTDRSYCEVVVRASGAVYPVWKSSVDYFRVRRKRLEDALNGSVARTGWLPRTDAEFAKIVEQVGFSVDDLTDPWGHRYYVRFPGATELGQELSCSIDPGAERATPVPLRKNWVRLLSAGPDGFMGTKDDFAVAAASEIVSEKTGSDAAGRPSAGPSALGTGRGAVQGVVEDSSGGVLPGVAIKVNDAAGQTKYRAVSGADGQYSIRDILPGTYSVEFLLAGFKPTIVSRVVVAAGCVTTVNVVVAVGGVAEAVQLGEPAVQTQSAPSARRNVQEPDRTTAAGRGRIMTPRLREDFPETLYWAPSVITDHSGTAKVAFELADSVTTWKVRVVASTVDGRIGTTDAEILAFQPFFVDHDPPRVLTVGDELDLPVVVRNYLPDTQQVDVQMAPASWFTLSGGNSRHVSVAAGDAATASFAMRTTAATDKGLQQVSAVSRRSGDRIEKAVRVHPDGEERTVSTTALLNEAATIETEVPATIIDGSVHSTLKIYPNLLAHVVESIEAGLRRPYGCAEQTISAAYPAVLLLRQQRLSSAVASDTTRRAARYVSAGLERLLTYRLQEGAFSLWAGRVADIAVTAYALRFLVDAAEVAPVDPSTVESAVTWLVGQQQPNGRWLPPWGDADVLTAHTTRAMARALASIQDPELKSRAQQAVRRGLGALALTRESYALALFALAALDAGRKEEAALATSKLETMAHREGDRAYWALETNTAFDGWGSAGRIESTALVVSALASSNEGRTGPMRDIISSGLNFLLWNKDQFGVWHSGQATVNVLEALLRVLGETGDRKPAADFVVVVNGQTGPSVKMPPTGEAAAPLSVDITRWLRPGANAVELRRAGGGPQASVQVVTTYYVPWRDVGDAREQVVTGDSRALRLAATLSKSTAEVGEAVRCEVEAERVGHRGHGMMLAEVGLPPGVDVDRASLDAALANSGYNLSAYEVQPDRVIFYLWPDAGGTRFAFTFRPRLAMRAKTAPSVLYDYYNPESMVTVAPVRFTVRARAGS